jgi:hypothetical protein
MILTAPRQSYFSKASAIKIGLTASRFTSREPPGGCCGYVQLILGVSTICNRGSNLTFGSGVEMFIQPIQAYCQDNWCPLIFVYGEVNNISSLCLKL